jgi:hypothetical protein
MPEYERRDGENTGLGYEVAGLERRHEELLT